MPGSDAMVGPLRPFDYRMAKRAFFQWNLLKLQCEFELPLSSPDKVTRDNIEQELLRIQPDLRQAFVTTFTVNHDEHCPEPGHAKALVIDLCAKTCRDQCIAKTNGALLVLAGKGVVNVGCPDSPAYMSPMCEDHSRRAAIAAETLKQKAMASADALGTQATAVKRNNREAEAISEVGAMEQAEQPQPQSDHTENSDFVNSLLDAIDASWQLSLHNNADDGSTPDQESPVQTLVELRLEACRKCHQRTKKFRQSPCINCPGKPVPLDQRKSPPLVDVNASPPPKPTGDELSGLVKTVARVINGQPNAYNLRVRGQARAEQEALALQKSVVTSSKRGANDDTNDGGHMGQKRLPVTLCHALARRCSRGEP
jgi:hypothetical protein